MATMPARSRYTSFNPQLAIVHSIFCVADGPGSVVVECRWIVGLDSGSGSGRIGSGSYDGVMMTLVEDGWDVDGYVGVVERREASMAKLDDERSFGRTVVVGCRYYDSLCDMDLFVLSGDTGLVVFFLFQKGLIKYNVFSFNEYHSFRVLIYMICEFNPTLTPRVILSSLSTLGSRPRHATFPGIFNDQYHLGKVVIFLYPLTTFHSVAAIGTNPFYSLRHLNCDSRLCTISLTRNANAILVTSDLTASRYESKEDEDVKRRNTIIALGYVDLSARLESRSRIFGATYSFPLKLREGQEHNVREGIRYTPRCEQGEFTGYTKA
ncbi:hypothetical protein BJ165DRAFT_1598371 [Panaeolus papilionaceus]|nr:hypothetical protein BJ165DRAFT_1598371 [Panaeolus papilionaceus]